MNLIKFQLLIKLITKIKALTATFLFEIISYSKAVINLMKKLNRKYDTFFYLFIFNFIDNWSDYIFMYIIIIYP